MSNDSPYHRAAPVRLPTRREFLWNSGGGLGGLALAAMLGRDRALAAPAKAAPAPRAKIGRAHV